MRVLIVDDNDRVRHGVMEILASRADCEICGQAKSGEEGIQLAVELRPDLILLDVSMPGLSGLEVARLLRKELPQVRIVIMSQHDPHHLLASAMEAGADACVDKARLGADLWPAIESVAGIVR